MVGSVTGEWHFTVRIGRCHIVAGWGITNGRYDGIVTYAGRLRYGTLRLLNSWHRRATAVTSMLRRHYAGRWEYHRPCLLIVGPRRRIRHDTCYEMPHQTR